MNYANYDTSIVLVYSVQLVNWPLDGGVVSPSQLKNTADMRKLRNALKAGECRWKKLTATEVQAHDNEIKSRHVKGEVISKPRKKRSDAGQMQVSGQWWGEGEWETEVEKAEEEWLVEATPGEEGYRQEIAGAY